MKLDKRYIKNIDWTILLILACLGVYSYLGISGSAYGTQLANRQLIWYGLGFAVLFISLLIDYRQYYGFSYIFYGIGIVLLIGVLFQPAINNTRSWYNLGPILFHPGELMKLFVILAVARYLTKRTDNPERFRYFYQLIPPSLLIIVPMLLIVIQPDLGTGLVFAGILATMLIVGGIRLRHMFYVGSLAGIFVSALTYLYLYHDKLFFKIIKPYQWDRVVYWLDPAQEAMGKGFQLIQSLIAIGSGQLFGKGVSTATQASYGWVPVGESDFIFTIIAEKMGFIGASVMMILFFFLIYRMIRIAMEVKDPFGAYVVSGVIGMLTFQVFENIGMTIQLMPITGIPLPFVSYGGSSLITNFLIIGVVLNVGMRRDLLRLD